MFPTDTVYGVGLSVGAAKNLDVLYDLKQRERRKPVAWLVSSIDDLTRYGSEMPPFANVLARALWPGPLTLIVRAGDAVPEAFRSAEGTIGLRMPRNATALSLLEAVGTPVATTSANRSGKRPPRTFDDVDPDFLRRVGYALRDDAVEAADDRASGIASTIIDCTGEHPVLMREGAFTIADIRALC